jgi:hypothetical protein
MSCATRSWPTPSARPSGWSARPSARRKRWSTRPSAECEQQCQEKLAAARAAAEHQRMLTLATVPVEIGRLRAIARPNGNCRAARAVRDQLLARTGFDYRESCWRWPPRRSRAWKATSLCCNWPRTTCASTAPTLAEAGPEAAGRARTSTVTIDAQPRPTSRRRDRARPAGAAGLGQQLRRSTATPVAAVAQQIAEQLGLQSTTQPAGGPS